MQVEQKIGFDKIRSMIASKCSTEYAAGRVADESITNDQSEISFRLQLTDEMRLICLFEENFPTTGYIDTKPFLLPLSASSTYIDLQSLIKLRLSLETLRSILVFFRGCKEDLYPNLRAISASVVYHPDILKRIGSILDRNNEVRDSASPALQDIRRALKEKEAAISRRIASILKKAQSEGIVDEDASVSVRDGRVLIPVASANKRKIPGLVYDESASGKTSFVEPMEVVELGNQVRELKFEEQREILRILLEFTDFIRPDLTDLIASSEYIGEMDFIRAKAQLGVDMRAGMPIISTEGTLALRKARHPLLEKALRREGKEMVPLTLTLTSDKHILLISGPNAGGKSVCLKTVGLLQYMFQWGLLIPTSETSEMVIFDDIFIDIGDNQSIENDLSTYSSHLSNMREIIENSTSKSLVLIDEFGSGTEPAAGGAIAEAVLAQLEEKGVYGVITTHYTNLKLYADGSRGVQNGAMQFDVNNIQPLFKLEQGTPGNSFAFELARKIGLPEDLIKDAETRAGAEFVNIERNLRKIARKNRVLDEKLARIKTTDKTLESLTDRYEKELGDIKMQKKKIIEEAKAEAQEIIDSANRQVEQTIREIKEAQAEKERTRSARQGLNEFRSSLKETLESETDRRINEKIERIKARKERERERREKRGQAVAVQTAPVEETFKTSEPLKVGDKVRVIDSDLVGEVTRIGAKNVSVAIGSIISKMASDRLEKISNQQYKEKTRPVKASHTFDATSISQRRLDFSPSIDIRGERLNDAMEIVMHYIDDAMMIGIGQVKILHGKGNGVLREEIRKYLRSIPGVASAVDEAVDMGGAGITVVKFD
jgi:Mismatch repair ATPase (MutS family)